jgi:hypothetical protein
MRLAILSTVLVATGALAQQPAPSAPRPPPPPPAPPRVFALAGYAEPPIGPAACHAVNAGETRCAIPAMTAGSYLVRATGVSTATAARAAQQLVIAVGDQSCSSVRRPESQAPWAVGARRSFNAACLFTVVTDAPLAVDVAYLDDKATKDPAGPSVVITPEPWSGAIEALPVRVPQ